MTDALRHTLDALLERKGLAANTRLLAVMLCQVGRGDWTGLALTAERARDRGDAREAVDEALLQAVLFFGFPRAVSGFQTVGKLWPRSGEPPGSGVPVAEQRASGTALFDRIYGTNAAAVHSMLRECHPEFHDFVIESAYGRVLARPQLPPRERELLAVAALAVLSQVPQLIAHARGAREFGATDDELREVLVTALGDVPLVAEHLRRIG